METIPHALQVEKSVLSVVMGDPDVADRCPHLSADHFHIPAHRILFERIQTWRKDNREFELVGFVQELLSAGLLDRCGGPSAIHDIYTHAATPQFFESHVKTLGEFRAFRAALRAADAFQSAAMANDAEELAQAAQNAPSAILDALTDGQAAKTTAQIVSESMAKFEERVRGTSTAMGIEMISQLDAHLRGAHPGRIFIIGAYPEGGKSVMASQIVIDAAADGFPTCFLTLEMSERDLMDRMIVQSSRVDAAAFREPKEYARQHGNAIPPKGILDAIQNGALKLAKAPIRLQRPANRRLSTVVASIRKAVREMDAKIIAVDYIQLIRTGGDHRNSESEVSEISHTFQEVAQDLGVTLLLLSQLNTEGDTKHGRVIEEDADAVIQIVQDRNKDSETYKAHRYVLIAKDRHYGSGGTRVPLILDKERIRFVHGEDQSKQLPKKPQFNR